MAKRLADNWQFNGSYSYTRSDVPFGAAYLEYTPNAEMFAADRTRSGPNFLLPTSVVLPRVLDFSLVYDF